MPSGTRQRPRRVDDDAAKSGPRTESPRQSRLRGRLSTGKADEQILDHWQLVVTAAGRGWYLVDQAKATIWIGYAGPGHPKAAG